MTKEDWKKVRVELQFPYGRAELLCDGYALTLQVQQVKPLKFEIGFYVNGFFKGEFIVMDCEERRRFSCPKQAFVFPPADRTRLLKELGTRRAHRMFPDIDKKFTWYSSHWSSFASLKRHLVANNKVIELKEIQ
ncbi:MAG: hypothetical protein V4573_17720 [Pseudomonadota bacterium]